MKPICETGNCYEIREKTRSWGRLDEALSTALALLKIIAIVDGTTLVVLMLIAMPLKRLLGIETSMAFIEPIRGMAFLVYLYAIFEAWGVRAYNDTGGPITGRCVGSVRDMAA